jgi:hypothetical protein
VACDRGRARGRGAGLGPRGPAWGPARGQGPAWGQGPGLGNWQRPQREHRGGDEPARRESNAHWRFRRPPSCPLDHGPRDAPRSRNRATAALRTASRASESCVAASPARLERATCCSGNSRAFLLRHGDSGATGSPCHQARRPPGRRPRGMRARGGTRTPNDRTADGFTGRCAACCATLAWGDRRGSNAQPPGSQPGALPG